MFDCPEATLQDGVLGEDCRKRHVGVAGSGERRQQQQNQAGAVKRRDRRDERRKEETHS